MCVDLPTPDTVAVLRALISLSTLDWLYTDQYLHRAEQLLSKFFSRSRYVGLQGDQERVPRVTQELREAAEHGEWSKVSALAEQGAKARGRLGAHSQILPIADAVYGLRRIPTGAGALALTGVVPQTSAELASTRDTVLNQLRALTGQDREWNEFYRARVQHFGGLQLVSGDKPGSVFNIAESQKQILRAVDAGDFARVKQLADTITDESGNRPARLRVPRPADSRIRNLAVTFPDAVVEHANELGLAMETLQLVGGMNTYLSCACAERATFPELPLTEAHRAPESCTCGHPCPPDVRPVLRDNLDFLMIHPFITSAGTRYLPWFGTETLLVETFPEAAPETRTGLLRALGLSQRRGLPRIRLEDALLTHGPDICADLGVDPLEYVVVCIPFDAYLRLAPRYGWGQQDSWTHLDGYQITRDLQVWALVGGYAGFGGPDDLSSVTRDYDSERLTARFAILRRDRFLVRETAGA